MFMMSLVSNSYFRASFLAWNLKLKNFIKFLKLKKKVNGKLFEIAALCINLKKSNNM